MKSAVVVCLGLLMAFVNSSSAEGPVFNEIHYHPVNDAPTEFIEIFNPTSQVINLSGYKITGGVEFTFPSTARITSKGYLLVVRNKDWSTWRNVTKLGNFTGKLSDGGEKLTLLDKAGNIVDTFTYMDYKPWWRGSDGYGPSLEKVSPTLPSNDYRSWRPSTKDSGTPLAANSVLDTPGQVNLVSLQFMPEHPTSNDDVQVSVMLESPEDIQSVTLKVETHTSKVKGLSFSIPMTRVAKSDFLGLYSAKVDKQASQTLVRCGFDVNLVGGGRLNLPHRADPKPFESYFVYDNEISTQLPILWIFPQRQTAIPEVARNEGGVVIKPLNGPVEVYDGVQIVASRNGQKITFVKGEEYQGNRKWNIIPESPPVGTTAGAQSPHVEQLSCKIFRELGVLAPDSDWLRVIENGNHTQRIFVQQPNENFLEMNGRDRDANIYKIAYNEPGGYSKKTNLDEDNSDYLELFQNVRTGNANLSAALRKYLVIEEVMAYQVASMLMSHWDGIMNNMFLYHDPASGKWEVIAWDMDKTFGYLDSDPMYWKMPLDFFLTGRTTGPESGAREMNNRNLRGPIGRPFHTDPELDAEFKRRVKEAMDGLFSEERITGKINEKEKLLLDDLKLLEQFTGSTRTSRRNQITKSYETMRFFLTNRMAFLRTQFPSNVSVVRTLPISTFNPGQTLPGIQIQLTATETTEPISVTELIPIGCSVSNITVSQGTIQLSSGQILWIVGRFQGNAQLTYDLIVPVDNAPISIALSGTMRVNQVNFPIEENVLRMDTGLGSDWVKGAGNWFVADGVLNSISEDDMDPKHVWVNKIFGTGDYTVRADVRMVNWLDGDWPRAGIAVRINPEDGDRGLNLLFHDDIFSVDMLNDRIAWGTRSDYSWQVGEWYTMTLQGQGSLLQGSIKRRDANEVPSVFTWASPDLQFRSPGFPGLTGSTEAGLQAQYDNFAVVVNGQTVFFDDFNGNRAALILTDVPQWSLY